MSLKGAFPTEEERRFIDRRARSLLSVAKRRKQEDTYFLRLANEFRFSIPLMPQDAPQEFPAGFNAQLEEEYAARYLEKIGAEPTPENVRLVCKKIPIKSCSVTAAWKSRGWLSDQIFVVPYAKEKAAAAAAAAAAATTAAAAAASGGVAHPSDSAGATSAAPVVNDAAAGTDAAGISGEGDFDPNALAQQAVAGESVGDAKECSFHRMKQRFVYPFNARSAAAHPQPPSGSKTARSPARRPTPPLRPGSAATAGGGSAAHPSASSPPSPGRGAQTSGPAWLADALSEVSARQELQRPLQVTVEEIEAVQRQFARSFPFKQLGSKLTPADVRALGKFLITTSVLRLVGLLAHYLHWKVLMGPALGRQLAAAEEEQLFMAIAGTWSAVHQQCAEQKARVVFFLPLVILSVRNALELVFRDAFPMYFAPGHEAGELALREIDSVAVRLMDPGEYASRISGLESTAEGLRMAARVPNNLRKRPLYHAKSSLVSNAVPKPSHGPMRAVQEREQQRARLRTLIQEQSLQRQQRHLDRAMVAVGASSAAGRARGSDEVSSPTEAAGAPPATRTVARRGRRQRAGFAVIATGPGRAADELRRAGTPRTMGTGDGADKEASGTTLSLAAGEDRASEERRQRLAGARERDRALAALSESRARSRQQAGLRPASDPASRPSTRASSARPGSRAARRGQASRGMSARANRPQEHERRTYVDHLLSAGPEPSMVLGELQRLLPSPQATAQDRAGSRAVLAAAAAKKAAAAAREAEAAAEAAAAAATAAAGREGPRPKADRGEGGGDGGLPPHGRRRHRQFHPTVRVEQGHDGLQPRPPRPSQFESGPAEGELPPLSKQHRFQLFQVALNRLRTKYSRDPVLRSMYGDLTGLLK